MYAVENAGKIVEKKKTGRPAIFSKEVADKVLSYVAKGLTYDRAAEAVGVATETISTWQKRYPQFDQALKKARRDLETSCLQSIHEAGAKSWQARAWLCERIFGYAQPSSRLEVAGAVAHAHAASPALAQLLAGMNGRSGDGIKNITTQAIDDTKEVSSIDGGQKKIRRVPRYSKRPTPPRPPALPPPPSATHNTPQKIATKNKKACDSTTTATNESTQEATQQTTGTS